MNVDPAAADYLLSDPRSAEGSCFVITRGARITGGDLDRREQLTLRLEIRSGSGAVVARNEFPQRCTHADEKALIARAIQLAFPKQWPVALEMNFNTLEVWDPRLTHAIPENLIDHQHWIGILAKNGWAIETVPNGVRFRFHKPVDAVTDAVDGALGALSLALGEKHGHSQGSDILVTVSKEGLSLAKMSQGSLVREARYTPQEVWALDSVATGATKLDGFADLTVYGPDRHLTLTLPPRVGRTEVAGALKLAIASVLVNEARAQPYRT